VTVPVSIPPRCRFCSAILTPPGHICGACRQNQEVPAVQHMTMPGQAKSPGLAVLFTFLWLGAGHLYVGQVGAGVGFAVVNGILVLLSLSLIGLIVAFPIWLIIAPIAMVLSATAAGSHNRRLGLAR
jgi:TM2 domain-containing membrane protein YozV